MVRPSATIQFGPQLTGDLASAATREWLLTDGCGGFAMGTVAGLRTRRYHGWLVVATEPPIGRRMALAAVDAVVRIGDRRIELATHEWETGAVAPAGHRLLDRFELIEGVPRWQWSAGGLVVTCELAMAHGTPTIAARWTVIAAPDELVELELVPLCTWRDVHGERRAGGDPSIELTTDGFEFEGAYRVAGPGFEPGGAWYHGVRHREEAARGLTAGEDLHRPGAFRTCLRVGQSAEISAWAGTLAATPPPASEAIAAARARFRMLATLAGAGDRPTALLAHAADQFVVATQRGPTVVAGYPWFGDWSRDTMTSYEGLFLDSGRADDGATLLRAAADTLSEGMLANTADVGGTEYNTVDATMWFLHAVGRHVDRTGDVDLGAALLPSLAAIVVHHVAGTRYGIRVDADGLVTHGAQGQALTWMDARVDGRPITQRAGKPVEVNALWISGLDAAARLAAGIGIDPEPFASIAERAATAFRTRFVGCGGLADVVDGDPADAARLRPNQLIAAARPALGLDRAVVRDVLRACDPLRTPIGLRSLSPDDVAYTSLHRGAPAQRDAAYHQGTVWPWLLGPLVDALRAADDHCGAQRVVCDAEPHLDEWGLGAVSETADGDAPHAATGCPFQAWSVAEWLRAHKAVGL